MQVLDLEVHLDQQAYLVNLMLLEDLVRQRLEWGA